MIYQFKYLLFDIPESLSMLRILVTLPLSVCCSNKAKSSIKKSSSSSNGPKIRPLVIIPHCPFSKFNVFTA